MAARPKPWEVRKSTSSSSGGSIPVSSSVARNASIPDVADSPASGIPGSISTTNPHIGGNRRTALPPRPSTISSSYGGGYGQSYGGYGSYGGAGSTYGSSYGGYGSYGGVGSTYGSNRYSSSYGRPYGSSYGGTYGNSYGSSYGGYGSGYGYGSYGRYGDPAMGGNRFLDSGHQQINRFGSMVESFSRFSRLLDANFDALHGSFISIIRVLDVFGEFTYVLKTFAVFRIFYAAFSRIYRLLFSAVGRKTIQNATNSTGEGIQLSDFKNFQNGQRRKRSYPVLIALGILLASAPFLLSRFWRSTRRILRELDAEGMESAWGSSSGVARAVEDFQGESPMDLSFRRGDEIKITGQPYPEWWEGEVGGRRGLFPANFVQMVNQETK